MKKMQIFSKLWLLAILSFFSIAGCAEKQEQDKEVAQQEQQSQEQASQEKDQQEPGIFPNGEKAPSKNFTGTAWVYTLVAPDSTYTTATGNVYFEAGARTNWHSHPPGQILIVTGGVGYHQIKGQPKETIRKGDVVKCPPNKLHWHGASGNNSMSHIYLVPNTEKGIVEWKDPVTDEEFESK